MDRRQAHDLLLPQRKPWQSSERCTGRAAFIARLERYMNRIRVAVLIASGLALVLLGLGILVIADPTIFGISPSACFGGCGLLDLPPGWVYGILLVGAGGLSALVALVLAATDAGRRGDWQALGLILLLFLLSDGAPAYLGSAVAATHAPGGRSAGAPNTTLVVIVVAGCVLLAPVTALVYGLLRDQRTPRLAALGGLAAVLVVAPLVVAPPWIAFNPANGAPVLAASAPNVRVDCAQGHYRPITLKNTGAGTLRWTAFAAFDAVTISPSSGSLGPGVSQTVTLMGAYTPSADRPQQVGVEFDSNGGSERVIYDCQGAAGTTPSSSGGISVTPPGIGAQCQQGTYPPVTVTNSSRGDAPWSVVTKEPGFTLSPQSGTLHSGQSQTLSISGTTSSPTFIIFFNGGQQTVSVACK